MINALGRRGLLILGLSCQVVILLFLQVCLIYPSDHGVVFLYLYIFFYGFSLGGTFYVYQAEVLPPELLPVASSVQWLLTFVISFYEVRELTSEGLFLVSFLFFLILLCGSFVFFGFSVETKFKSNLQILDRWKIKTFQI